MGLHINTESHRSTLLSVDDGRLHLGQVSKHQVLLLLDLPGLHNKLLLDLLGCHFFLLRLLLILHLQTVGHTENQLDTLLKKGSGFFLLTATPASYMLVTKLTYTESAIATVKERGAVTYTIDDLLPYWACKN